MFFKTFAFGTLATTLLGTPATSIVAQPPNRSVVLAVGPASFDASGTGDTYTVAGRIRQSMRAWLGGELGVNYLPLDEQFAPATTHLLSVDGQVQLQATLGRLRPYVGAGPSIVSYLSQQGGRGVADLGVSVGVGLHVSLSSALSGVVDARYRGWYMPDFPSTPVNGSIELTLGLGRRF